MGDQSCHYDCSNPPTELSPYPDISGIGVSLSYSVTAGLALLIVLFYYVLAYTPDVRYFVGPDRQIRTSHHRQNYKINPVDVYLLMWRLKNRAHNSLHDRDELPREHRIKNALMHCMLILSDFQLVTGLSILISGFTQLRCGISIYHWHKVVHLAWFSSITHLCCLTFLRDYFYRHRIAQFWRIPGMVILIIMLTIALIPTAEYTWSYQDISRKNMVLFVSKPAICSFFPRQNLKGFSDQAGIQRAAISIILLIAGMCLRLCHLYSAPVLVFARVRKSLSTFSRRSFLGRIYSWCDFDSPFPVLTTICLYRPFLTLFLCYRILFDVASSKAFEVFWLAISFGWGSLNLWRQKYDIEPESREWSFGQVIALVALVAPFLSLVEGYLTNASPSAHSSTNQQNHDEGATIPAPQSRDSFCISPLVQSFRVCQSLEHDPDFDFYSTFGFPTLFFASLITIVQTCIWTLVAFAGGWFTPLQVFTIYSPYTLLMSLAVNVLMSLIFSKFEPRSRKKRIMLKAIYFLMHAVMFQVGIATAFMGTLFGFDMMLRFAYGAVYVGLSCWHAYRVKRRLHNGSDGIWQDE